MTVSEKLHKQHERELAERLEEQGLSLHRYGGLYEVVDADGLMVMDGVGLAQIMEWMESW